jgi:hypothetical protein
MIYDFAQTALNDLAADLDAAAAALTRLQALLAANQQPQQAAGVGQMYADAAQFAEAVRGAAAVIPYSGSARGAFATARTMLTQAGTVIVGGTSEQASAGTIRRSGLLPKFNAMFGNEPSPGALAGVDECRELLAAARDRATTMLGEIVSVTEPEGVPFSLRGVRDGVQSLGGDVGGIRSGVDNLTSYPMLVSDLERGQGPGGADGGTPVQRLVDTALRQTLGRIPKYTDSKAFLAALNQSFEISQFEGQTLVNWRVRSYVGQTELGGGVTGYQASVYARARDALAQTTPLLRTLRPLIADPDPEEIAAAKSIVASQFDSVVTELGVEGGPRAARVDDLFDTLLRDPVYGQDVTVQGGMLGYLQFVHGLDEERVNTPDEEQALSDFLLMRDYITSVEASWRVYRDQHLGSDLGTQLVLLSNALQVVGESVDEIEAAMDSVFVGAAERTVTPFRIADSPPRDMLVSELLSWTRTFATSEAPLLVQEGGRRGVGAILGTTTELIRLLGLLIKALPILPAGLRHPRVQQPLSETRDYLRAVEKRALALLKAAKPLPTPQP